MDQLIVATKPHISPHPLPPCIGKIRRSPFKLNFSLPQQSQVQKFASSSFREYPNLEQTQQIHAHFIKTSFNHTHLDSLNLLQPHLSPAAKCNLLVTSYTKNNSPEDAINVYAQLRRQDCDVDNFILPSVLKACGQVSWVIVGKEIHGFAVKIRFGGDLVVCNALVHMYGECGTVECARLLFDRMADRDVVSWSTMIGSSRQNKLLAEALKLIREMLSQGVEPNEAAIVGMVTVFADLLDVKMGKAIHGYAIKKGNNERLGVSVATALVDMYGKCRDLSSAERLFNRLYFKTVVSWGAIVGGCIRNDRLEHGAKLFIRMLEADMFPNEIMLVSLVMECAFAGALSFGKWMHAFVLRNGIKMSVALASALVDMYGKCRDVRYARHLFDGIKDKDAIVWSVMVSAYAQASCIEQAFDLFTKMRDCGIRPNNVTVVSILSLCVEAGALDLGKWVHAYVTHEEVEVDVILKTALVDMYAKCGDIDTARRLFSETRERDIGLWNAMIAGFAMHGCGREALELFSEMERIGIEPNEITFIGLLHACSHAGLVAEGRRLFTKMVQGFSLAPMIEHYGCLVDLLGRAGHLDDALDIIVKMPIEPNTVVWGALLAACKLHKNLSLGEVAAKKILELEPRHCGYGVLMSNIYAAASRWNDVSRVRRKMEGMGIRKEAGLSSIIVNGSVHNFKTGDRTHPQTERVYQMLAEMNKKIKEAGYTPETSVVLLNLIEEEKETALNYHSEKLAMAFGLINTAPGSPIRIVKNLRVCDDCHNATKLLSKVYGRAITVRDRNRFHHFVDGSCSCCDYW